jgi:hypothetical protein
MRTALVAPSHYANLDRKRLTRACHADSLTGPVDRTPIDLVSTVMSHSEPPYPSSGHIRRRFPTRAAVAGFLVVVVVVALALVRGGDRELRATVPVAGATLGEPTGGPVTRSAAALPATPPPASATAHSAAASGSAVPPRCGASSGCPAALGGPAPPIPAPPGKRWALTFSEEFTGTHYDPAKVSPCFDWNTGECTATFNEGREHYLPSQVHVSDGTAKLVAAPAADPIASPSCQNGSCTYVAGLLSTARPRSDTGQPYLYKFTYGFVEARLKFPATRGFFTAFWMLPADPSFTYRTEIDILEMLGDDPTTMFMTYNYDNRTKSYAVNKKKHNNGACPVKDYSKKFVDVAVDWEPDRIAWYIDGVKCAQYTDASQIESGPMQIILHLMVDNTWQRQWNVGLTDPTLVRQLEVDYLRVYQRRPA